MGVVHDYEVTTKDPTGVDNDSAVLQGNSAQGSWECIQWGFYYYKDGDDPGGATYIGASAPAGEGDFAKFLPGSPLDPYTKYWQRAYARYKIWDAVELEWVYANDYGEWEDFTTHAYPYLLAIFACNINKSTGAVTFWSAVSDSDGDNVVEVGFEYGLTKTATWTVSSGGNFPEATFSVEASGLPLNTDFYARAYLKSSSGHYDYTDEWMKFTTKDLVPVIAVIANCGYFPDAEDFFTVLDANGVEVNSYKLPVGNHGEITVDAHGDAYYGYATKTLCKRRLSDGVAVGNWTIDDYVRGICVGPDDDYIFTLEDEVLYKRHKATLLEFAHINLITSYNYVCGITTDMDGHVFLGRTYPSDRIEKYAFYTAYDIVNVTTYENHNIIAVVVGVPGAGSFKIAGDHTAELTAGKEVTIAGSTGNDGTYTVSTGGATLDGADTIIPVDEAVSDATVDGTLTEVGIYSFEIAGDHTSEFTDLVDLTIEGSTGNDGTYVISAGGSSYVGGNTVIPVNTAIPDATIDGAAIRAGSLTRIAYITSPRDLTYGNLAVVDDYIYAGAWFDYPVRANKALNSITTWVPSGAGWHAWDWFYHVAPFKNNILLHGLVSSNYQHAIAMYDSSEARQWFLEFVRGPSYLAGYPFIVSGAVIENVRAENNSVFARTLLYGEITDREAGLTVVERGFEYKIQESQPSGDDTGTEVKEISAGYDNEGYNLRNKELYDQQYIADNIVWWFRAYCKDDNDVKYTADSWMRNIPTVTTEDATEITYNQVDGNGEVTNRGASELTQRGFEVTYEFSGSLRDSWKFEIAGFEGELESKTTVNDIGVIIDYYWEGTLVKTVFETYELGVGIYDITIGQMILGWPVANDCLIEGRPYTYVAFAKNEFGTAYGGEKSFSTLSRTYLADDPPTTGEFTIIKNEIIGGLPAGVTASRRGFRYGTTEAADEFDVHENGSFTDGPYSMMLVDLLPDTTYYIYAYIVVEGIIYEGDLETITTDPEGTEDEDEYPTPHYSPHGQDYREMSTKVFAEVLASQGVIDFSGGRKTLPITNHLIQTNPDAKTIADAYLVRFKLAKTRMTVSYPTPLPFEREDTVDFSLGHVLFKENDLGVIAFKEDGEGVLGFMDQITMMIKKINSVGLVKTEESMEYVAVLDLEHE